MIVKDYKKNQEKISLTLSGTENLVATYDIKQSNYNLLENIKYGTQLELEGSLKKPINNTIPNAFNYKKYLEQKNIFYILEISNIKIIKQTKNPLLILKNFMSSRINSFDNKGYIKAFILGDKSLIDSDVYKKYQKIGVTHLFALSGMHVGLLSSIILKLLKKTNKWTKYFIVNIFLWAYGFIVGFPSSIKRCLLFFLINTLNKIFNLELKALNILFITILLLVLIDYSIIYDVGFRFSVCTVSGILIANEYINKGNILIKTFKLSLVAFLFSIPISLTSFYEINIFSPLYNLFFVPFVTIIVYPFSLLTFLFPILYPIFNIMILIMENFSAFLSDLTFSNLYLNFNIYEVIIFYLCLILVFYKRKTIFYLVILSIVVGDLFIPYFDSNGYLYFFDVGQGDSSLIISPYRKDIIMIDTGGIVSFNPSNDYMVSDSVITFLKSKGIKKISKIIISHGHIYLRTRII